LPGTIYRLNAGSGRGNPDKARPHLPLVRPQDILWYSRMNNAQNGSPENSRLAARRTAWIWRPEMVSREKAGESPLSETEYQANEEEELIWKGSPQNCRNGLPCTD
jgi:hypothetical protein